MHSFAFRLSKSQSEMKNCFTISLWAHFWHISPLACLVVQYQPTRMISNILTHIWHILSNVLSIIGLLIIETVYLCHSMDSAELSLVLFMNSVVTILSALKEDVLSLRLNNVLVAFNRWPKHQSQFKDCDYRISPNSTGILSSCWPNHLKDTILLWFTGCKQLGINNYWHNTLLVFSLKKRRFYLSISYYSIRTSPLIDCSPLGPWNKTANILLKKEDVIYLFHIIQ